MPESPVRRALVTSWSTFVHGEATAGDLLAARTVEGWLRDADVPFDTALSPIMGGPSLDEVDAADYSHLLFVCGPAVGWQVEDLLARFPHAVKVAVGVSVLDTTPPGFDLLLSRDGRTGDRPDLALAAASTAATLPPRIALVRAHPGKEYPDGRHDDAHRVIDDVLRELDVAVTEVDTRVDPRNVVSRRTSHVEALLAGVDAVVSTRMHGLVLALRHGTPAIAVDPIPGGAKVFRQAATLGWPGVVGVDALDPEHLAARIRWALTPEAAELAADCARRGRDALVAVGRELVSGLATLRPAPPPPRR